MLQTISNDTTHFRTSSHASVPGTLQNRSSARRCLANTLSALLSACELQLESGPDVQASSVSRSPPRRRETLEQPKSCKVSVQKFQTTNYLGNEQCNTQHRLQLENQSSRLTGKHKKQRQWRAEFGEIAKSVTPNAKTSCSPLPFDGWS